VAESVLDFVLDGLEKALELGRELGVRTVEIDRELLKVGESQPSDVKGPPREPPRECAHLTPLAPAAQLADARGIVRSRSHVQPSADAPMGGVSYPELKQSNNSNNQTILPLVFVHDRPLSEKGVEMMAKILTAMGRTAENTPIVIAPPLPKAKIVVVLGGLALRKYFPEMRGEPGQWQKTPEGRDVLITYSPEYILRFATVTPAVAKIKQDMWRSLKAVVQRLR